MAMPKYFQNDDSIKVKANRREAKVFKHLVSGALQGHKGDFSTRDSVIEQKSTDKKSFHITENILIKLTQDTLEMGKLNSVLIIDLPEYYLICKVQKKSTSVN